MAAATDSFFRKFLKKGLKMAKKWLLYAQMSLNDQNSAYDIFVRSLYNNITFTSTQLLKIKKKLYFKSIF